MGRKIVNDEFFGKLNKASADDPVTLEIVSEDSCDVVGEMLVKFGDHIRQWVGHRFSPGEIVSRISVDSTDTAHKVAKWLKIHGVCQVKVVIDTLLSAVASKVSPVESYLVGKEIAEAVRTTRRASKTEIEWWWVGQPRSGPKNIVLESYVQISVGDEVHQLKSGADMARSKVIKALTGVKRIVNGRGTQKPQYIQIAGAENAFIVSRYGFEFGEEVMQDSLDFISDAMRSDGIEQVRYTVQDKQKSQELKASRNAALLNPMTIKGSGNKVRATATRKVIIRDGQTLKELDSLVKGAEEVHAQTEELIKDALDQGKVQFHVERRGEMVSEISGGELTVDVTFDYIFSGLNKTTWKAVFEALKLRFKPQ